MSRSIHRIQKEEHCTLGEAMEIQDAERRSCSAPAAGSVSCKKDETLKVEDVGIDCLRCEHFDECHEPDDTDMHRKRRELNE